ncbi:MAG: hypothetical protein ACREB5_02225 [Sphingomonadaceae bacterium]
MSETSVAIAQGFAARQAASTRQTLQTVIVQQQAASDQALVDLLQRSAETQKATLAAGQGQSVDILA